MPVWSSMLAYSVVALSMPTAIASCRISVVQYPKGLDIAVLPQPWHV